MGHRYFSRPDRNAGGWAIYDSNTGKVVDLGTTALVTGLPAEEADDLVDFLNRVDQPRSTDAI